MRSDLSKWKLFVFIPLFVLSAACAAPLSELASDYAAQKPKRIAVLPPKNETSDLDAPIVFRILAAAELADRGYSLINFQRLDEALQQRGIQEGGQIDALTLQEIGNLADAEGLLYINVMGYGRQVGVHLRMEGSFTLVDSRTGRKLWFSELSVSDDIALEGGVVALGAELLGGKDARKKALNSYLQARKARRERAVAKFRSHPRRRQVFQVITLDMEKIPLLDDFFSKNFRSLPPA